MVADLKFRVMGCQARVVVNGADPAGLAAYAVDRLEELESRWSRFRADSEVSALNRGSGEVAIVSPDTYILIDHAIKAWDATQGLFDPTMLNDPVSHGYDRSHAHLAQPEQPASWLRADGELRTTRLGRCGEIDLFPDLCGVRLPAGTGLDPGGIGKGLGADMVASELMGRGAKGALVDLGGDIRVIGEHPDGGALWTILVDDPCGLGHDSFRIGFSDGGIATSSQLLRRWSTRDGDKHHLLDPQTGDPAMTPVAAAVAATGAAWWAEVLAKAAIIAGFDRAERLVRSNHAAGALFGFDDGVVDIDLLTHAEID